MKKLLLLITLLDQKLFPAKYCNQCGAKHTSLDDCWIVDGIKGYTLCNQCFGWDPTAEMEDEEVRQVIMQKEAANETCCRGCFKPLDSDGDVPRGPNGSILCMECYVGICTKCTSCGCLTPNQDAKCATCHAKSCMYCETLTSNPWKVCDECRAKFEAEAEQAWRDIEDAEYQTGTTTKEEDK